MFFLYFLSAACRDGRVLPCHTRRRLLPGGGRPNRGLVPHTRVLHGQAVGRARRVARRGRAPGLRRGRDGFRRCARRLESVRARGVLPGRARAGVRPFAAPSAQEGGVWWTACTRWRWDRVRLPRGLAGVIARTASAPLDRIKLLFQVQAMEGAGVSATAYTGIGQAFVKIYREEGILAFWRGNGVNVIRVAPYAAAQLSSNDFYKKMLTPESGTLGWRSGSPRARSRA